MRSLLPDLDLHGEAADPGLGVAEGEAAVEAGVAGPPQVGKRDLLHLSSRLDNTVQYGQDNIGSSTWTLQPSPSRSSPSLRLLPPDCSRVETGRSSSRPPN